MFDLSFGELAVIALVALLVLGPERLPKAARTAGIYLRKARESWNSVKADIERELAATELKRSLKSGQETGRQMAASPHHGLQPPAEGESKAARTVESTYETQRRSSSADAGNIPPPSEPS